MTIDAIIFDLDGTLWDVTPTVAKARNNALYNLGITHQVITAEDVAKTVGLPIDECYSKCYPSFSQKQLNDFISEVNKEMKYLLPTEGAFIYPGVIQGLQKLKEKYELYIVSNCDQAYIETFLRWSKLENIFKDYECFGRTKNGKGKNILDVIERNQLISPVYIGDTEHDQKAAIEAKIKYLHVSYGFGKPAFPCVVFNDFTSLTQNLIHR